MFNDESSDLNVLVASDAIGMGLNLNISRIIFSTMLKFDGFCHRELTVSEIKQIAGIDFFSLLKSSPSSFLSAPLVFPDPQVFLPQFKCAHFMCFNLFAGRAGRYGSKFPVGEVTCLRAQDLPLLHSSLKSPSPIIEVISHYLTTN